MNDLLATVTRLLAEVEAGKVAKPAQKAKKKAKRIPTPRVADRTISMHAVCERIRPYVPAPDWDRHDAIVLVQEEVTCSHCGSVSISPESVLRRAWSMKHKVVEYRPLDPIASPDIIYKNLPHEILSRKRTVLVCRACFSPETSPLAVTITGIIDPLPSDEGDMFPGLTLPSELTHA